MTKIMKETVEIPEEITVTLDKNKITVKGTNGEVTKDFVNPAITITQVENKIEFQAKKSTKREKMKIGTFKAHLKNMFNGATSGHVYKVKICSGHFPMNVTLSGDTLTVKNFLGEKIPRIAKAEKGTKVKLENDIITIQSTSKEAAGQTAANFERSTRITNRDRRIFQDGLFIIEKDGKQIK